MVGECLGEAFQVADDLLDAFASATAAGKPVGRDAALGRPNAVIQLGARGARERFVDLVTEAAASVPDCLGRDALRVQIAARAARLLPQEAALSAV
jgi:geranylgeranyl diphosphate synthase type II